ncbi:cytochrome b subunit of succinate dehydrogenase, Sdh3p [Thecaphora frezii]
MPATKTLQLTHRLLAHSVRAQPGFLGLMLRSSPTMTAMAVVPRIGGQVRTAVTTSKMTQGENLELLNSHRASRPISPHMTIYQPQLTWYASIANRMTGAGLSALMYGYAIAYVAAPHLGLAEALSSASVVELVSHLPFWLKLAVKAPLAAAFSFHNLNGLRHLAWDYGYFLNLKGVYASGYAVLAATAVSTIALCSL